MSDAAPPADKTAAPARRDPHEQFAATLPLVLENLAISRNLRAGATLLSSLIALIWVDWRLVAGVVALILLHEGVTFPWILKRVVTPLAARDPKRAHILFATANASGALLYTATWAPVMASGGVLGAFLGAGWFWGTLIHNMTYNSRDRLIFVTCMTPPVVAALAVPFYLELPWWGPWVAMYLTAQGVVAMLMATRDRNKLAIAAERHEKARHIAEEANIQKSRFLTTMSHELRTPLNAIIGYAEILEEDLEAAPEDANADDARRIRRAARHLLLLINEVLDLSKIEAGRLELINGPVDVAALLREVEETVRPIGAGNGNKVVLDIVGRIPTLEIDAARLKQCLLNLATNACKFTKDGRVTIRASMEMRAGASVLEVAVIDTGIGISHEDQARLFQPFVQVDGAETRKQDGTGLGLVITRKLAQAMGGDVALVSSPGLGSTFTLTIAARVAAEVAPSNQLSGPVVLVIEDDPTARDLTVRALTRLSFNVRAATSAAEGLAMIAEEAPDLVILDIHLPDMSGWDVLARLKTGEKTSALPVLVVTIDDDRARALDLGACDHMQKPVDRDRLTAAAVRFALPHQPRIAAPTPVVIAAEARKAG
ncbi:MAG: ATP-binding protein [Hyphomonadaceae bacterium]|nr:ATP-binding protein [Hyphomonadaceae bacterium]